jgi:dipeptidyl-peptidase-4
VNPGGYRIASVVEQASRLTRPLQLIHGTTDDNVHFAHSMALIEALFRAGKPFELLPVSATHMTTDPELGLALHRARLAFFRKCLGP